MGTLIKAASISVGGEMLGSIEHAARAAEQCIATAGIDKQDIDLLVHVGIYREDNIAEPPMAPLIQQRLGLNLDPVKHPVGKTTFSFDLANGACGFLYAAQVIDAILKNGGIKQALIVSSDVHPSKKQIPDFPYTHLGAAVLLTRSDQKEKGFKNFMFRTSEDGYSGVEGYHDLPAYGNEGRKCITVTVQDDYSRRLQEFTVRTVKEYVESRLIDVSDIRLLITSQPAPGFGRRIAESIGLKENSVVDVYDKYGDPHTSALSIGYFIAAQKGLFKENDQILFIGAGSGLTSACGLYVV